MSLDYKRQYPARNYSSSDDKWNNWTDNPADVFRQDAYNDYPQPILSDIEIADDGSFILGFLDRMSLQGGHANYAPNTGDDTLYKPLSAGDIKRICKVGSSYIPEGQAGCPFHEADGDKSEYYTADQYAIKDDRRHWETALGGLAMKSGSGELLSSEYDPYKDSDHTHAYSGGVKTYDDSDGTHVRGKILYSSKSGDEASSRMGKAGGVGDVELLEEPPKTYCLGDTVWYDDDKDGIQDAGEKGVANVKVTLNTGATTTTDANGKYKFCDLANGTYNVTFDKNTLPPSYVITKKDQGGDDAKDSDADTTTGKTADVTIKDADNMTLDMGIYKPAEPTYCLGDFVWIDANQNGIQDAGEKGVKDVKVTLNTGATTTTDANGKYKFCGLKNGTYNVTFDKNTLPPSYVITKKDQGGDDAKDSDADTTTGKTADVAIKDADNMTLDMGIYKPTKPSIDLEKHTNGKDADTEEEAVLVEIGDPITWEYIMKNNGTEDLENIKVTDDKEGDVTAKCPKTELKVGEEYDMYLNRKSYSNKVSE